MSARVRQVYDCPYDILYRVLTPDHNATHTSRMSRVSRFPSRAFRSRGTYHGWNHNNEWPQFSRYKPRDGTASLLAFRIKPVKRNAEARIFNAVSRKVDSQS